ncbi:MAG: ABC transporter permease [Proteobacteria bacterium]|nr:ABC transporter permease [Pseudomonadota bacterium]
MSAQTNTPNAGPPPPSVLQRLKNAPNAIRVVSVITLFLAWEFLAGEADRLFIAPPSEIFSAAVWMIEDGTFWLLFTQSMEHFIIGTVLSIVLGTAIGIALALWWQAEYILDPFINGFYAIPKPALVPLFILWFGLETTSKVMIILSVAIFPMIINTYVGIKDTRGSMLDIGRAFGASERQIFFKIILPGSIPYVMAGVRLAVGLGIIGMIIAEFFTAMVGFGGWIRETSDQFETAQMYFLIIVVGAFGIVLTELVGALERRISRWRILEQERVQG